jgi:hypothetical protein
MSSKAAQTEAVGLFPVSYRIGGNKPGAVAFDVHLAVSTPTKTVHGAGLITQAVNPPHHQPTALNGEYTFMTVMPNKTHILVVAKGYGPVSPTQEIETTNVRLRMVLSKDWQSGTANFDYLWNGKWNTVDNASVTIIAARIPE